MILITGAIGFVGRHVVETLVKQGRPVRILVSERNLLRPLPWGDDIQPEIVTGTIGSEEILFQAMAGVHTVIHLSSAQWWGRPRELERVELVGTRNLINVARAARVGRIIVLSQLGSTPSSAFSLLKIKGRFEELIRNSGLAYTLIRPGIVYGEDDSFINHIAMMLSLNPVFFLMPGQGEVILHPIYIDDLVLAIVRSLDSVDTVDRTLEIGGAEYVTFEDLIMTVMRVTHMRRFILPVPPYMMRFVTSVYSRFFRRSLITSQWLDILAASRTARIGNMYDYFGVHPRRFEDTLLTYLPKKRFFFRALRYVFRRRPRSI